MFIMSKRKNISRRVLSFLAVVCMMALLLPTAFDRLSASAESGYMLKVRTETSSWGRVLQEVTLPETGEYILEAYFKQTVGTAISLKVMRNDSGIGDKVLSETTDDKTSLHQIRFLADQVNGDGTIKYQIALAVGGSSSANEAYLYLPSVYKADDASKTNLLANTVNSTDLSGWVDRKNWGATAMNATAVAADPSVFAYKDITPPTFAANAQITAATSSSLSVSWDAASDDATAAEQIVYKVYASTSAFGGTLSGEPLATVTGTTSAELTGLTANTAYYLAIAAIDEAGNSAVWYGENPAKTSPASSSTTGELVISADVGVAYTLSIPSAPVNMTAAGEQKLGTLYATALRLGANDTLNVTVAHNDVLTHVNGTNTLAYALSAAAHGSAEKAALAPITFTNGSTLGEAGGTDLFVSIDEADWNAAPAGVYKDTVTFTVAYTAG